MQVARVEPANDAAAHLVEHGIFLADRPIPRERPHVETRRCGGVDVARVRDGAAAASVATAAKVTAMPASIGNPLRAKGRSALANTKGRTGMMQGLTMVRTPPT
jgi:hypothetical protein